MIEERNRGQRVTSRMRRLTPLNIALIAAAILSLAFVLWTVASTRRGNPDALTAANSTAEPRAPDPAKRCAAQSTYDLIKRDLFRRAAALRGSDQAAFDRIASYSVVRVDQPLLDSEDDRTGAVACSGTLTLDLPPGVAVVGGRRTLNADIGYALQRSADGNGEVLTLTRADAVITPLATLARLEQPEGDQLAPAAPDQLEPAPSMSPRPDEADLRQAPLPPPATRADTPPPAPPSRTTTEMRPAPSPAPTAARPSFDCANARTRGEIAVCSDTGLAALDRQMAAQYVEALRDADPQTRAMLRRSRDRFLGYRDRCPSNDCIAETYRGRIREIRDISSGRLR